ncbi:hypothetical protein OOZ63_15940 [Paucibacter sp. PLA-PC-4]|uniref:hypothetical protein n=1 Tax=Paucibacter sp. PLA-PC-4 TaxID=2993655 RepID=UPI0022499A99|nr:hypothetical protein [Paucibacter sp. PLA-PC-4]MCX2863323.1 hypothetical protein [Paucibacter sp. PLA-PC-4]
MEPEQACSKTQLAYKRERAARRETEMRQTRGQQDQQRFPYGKSLRYILDDHVAKAGQFTPRNLRLRPLDLAGQALA